MFDQFQALLAHRQPRFVCTDLGWPEPGPERHVAYLRHEFEPPLDTAALARLKAQVGDLPEVLEFYRRWGGARLYRDTVAHPVLGQDAAFLIAPPDAWSELRGYFEDWTGSLTDDERIELLPSWIDDIVVFGEVPNSGNYFLLVLAGDARGQVFAFDHDGFEFSARGGFAEFIERLATVDAALLADIRSHTRYADGRSDTQWLCREYVHGPEAADVAEHAA